MSLPAATTTVPPAHGDTITDEVLAAAIDATARANAGQLTDADGALLLLVALPCFRELLEWRRRAAVIRAAATPGNVILLSGAR